MTPSRRRMIALALASCTFAPERATAEFSYVTQWGEYGVGLDQFIYPTGIAIGPNGDVYVTDGGNDRVTRFTPDGQYVDTIGGYGTGPGKLDWPHYLDFSPTNGDFYITDFHNHRVQRFTPEGDFVLQWGSLGNGPGQFGGPWGIHVDSDGNVWVVSQDQMRIQKFTENGGFLMQWGVEGSGPGQFMKPHGILTDAEGNVYVSDVMRHDIQKFDSIGEYLLQWGSPGSLPGQFLHPHHLSYVHGDIVVVDWLEHPHGGRLTSFSTMGVFQEVLVESHQGTGELEFNTIWAAAYDGDRDWYLVEWGNHRVQRLRDEAVGVGITTSSTPLLGDAIPNPSSGAVRIQFNIPKSLRVSGLEILDVRGRCIFSHILETPPSGPHDFDWNGTDRKGSPVAAGLYFLTLRGDDFTETRKIVRVR